MRILETLARAELTDGLTFSQLVADPACRLRQDATVVPILTQVTEEAAIALGNLKRRGLAVSVLLNLYETWDFDRAAEALARREFQPTICVTKRPWRMFARVLTLISPSGAANSLTAKLC